jgi:hypothetical protein
MKKELVAVICLVGLCVSGCTTDAEAPNKSMKVVVEGGGQFPPSLAGTWQADQDGWIFVIGVDGRISSAVISFGRVEVKPGRITTTRALAGGNAIFEPGQWTVDFRPDTSELTIKITMRHIHVEAGENIVDGRSTDTFIGRVNADQGFWPVQWTMFSHYTTHATDNPGREISTDPDKGETKPLIFRKIDVRK